MGKDQELLQAVKTEDLMTVQKLLQRPKPGKASRSCLIFIYNKAFALLLAMLSWLVGKRDRKLLDVLSNEKKNTCPTF